MPQCNWIVLARYAIELCLLHWMGLCTDCVCSDCFSGPNCTKQLKPKWRNQRSVQPNYCNKNYFSLPENQSVTSWIFTLPQYNEGTFSYFLMQKIHFKKWKHDFRDKHFVCVIILFDAQKGILIRLKPRRAWPLLKGLAICFRFTYLTASCIFMKTIVLDFAPVAGNLFFNCIFKVIFIYL